MPLPEPRTGTSYGFSSHLSVSEEITLGNPERIIWSLIKQLCAYDTADLTLFYNHNIRKKSDRKYAIKNLKLYINQAYEFYEVAEAAKPNTAPLLYYYCFLNLAKARCEIYRPRFHRTDESYRHGITWRPNRKYLVNLEDEFVSLTNRGVWHILWEALVGRRCEARNPSKIKIKNLLHYCPEISVECLRTFKESSGFINIKEPDVLYDPDKLEVWIKFSVDKYDLKANRLSRNKMLQSVTYNGNTYRQVKSNDDGVLTFESTISKKFARGDYLGSVLREEIKAFNLFVFLAERKLNYAIAIQNNIPILMPQILTLYTILFWLGSLVRYDPHSVAGLQDSSYWILIDGFMNQSRIWLLELFEWEFFKTQTVLMHSR